MLKLLKIKFILGLKWTTFSAIVSLLFSLIQWGIFGRYLDSEQIGLLSYCLVIVGICEVIADLGLSDSIIHFQEIKPRILNSIYLINLICSVGTYAIIFVSAPLLCRLLTEYQVSEFTATLRIFGLSVIINGVGNHYNNLLQKDLKFKVIAIFELIQKSISITALIFVTVFYDLNLIYVVLIMIFGSFIFATLLFHHGSRNIYRPKFAFHFEPDLSKFITFGKFQLGSSLFTRVSGNIVRFFIGAFFGVGNLGVYEQAYRVMIKPILLINPIINKVTLPTFSRIQKDFHTVNSWYLTQTGIISLLIFPLFGYIFFFSEEICYLLYGSGKEDVAEILRILCVLGLFIAISNPIGSYLSGLGKPNYGLYMNLYRLVLFVLFFTIIQDSLEFTYSIILYVATFIIGTWPIDILVRKLISNMSILKFLIIVVRGLICTTVMISFMYIVQKADFNTGYYFMPIIIPSLTAVLTYIASTYILNKEMLNRLLLLIKKL